MTNADRNCYLIRPIKLGDAPALLELIEQSSGGLHLIGSEPWRFGDMVIAELRGICGKEGSPLYDHLFEYKLDKTFLEADADLWHY